MPVDLLSTSLMMVCATFCVMVGSRKSITFRKELKEQGGGEDDVPAMTARSALYIPVVASGSLTLLYFLFNYIQYFLVIYILVAASGSLCFVCLPTIKLIWPARANLLNCSLAGIIVLAWLVSGHWLFVDIIGMSLAITMIAVLRIGSLKAAVFCLVGLFVYDIFWVFFSPFFFGGDNVMVEVATKNADNPAQKIAESLNVPFLKEAASELVLPMKLVLPSLRPGRFAMLGLGDIAVPGLFLAFALQFDAHRRARALRRLAAEDDTVSLIEKGAKNEQFTKRDTDIEIPPEDFYFKKCLAGYVIGLFLSALASALFRAAQPALLYLVPGVLLPLAAAARRGGHLGELWRGFEGGEGAAAAGAAAAGGAEEEGAGGLEVPLLERRRQQGHGGAGLEGEEEGQGSGASSDSSFLVVEGGAVGGENSPPGSSARGVGRVVRSGMASG